MSHWDGYAIRDYRFEFAAGSRVLDVGCGEGDQLRALEAAGSHAFGMDPFAAAVEQCRSQGLTVARARAERMPFASGSFDGAVCRVVLPYTDERLAVSEIGRVLRSRGRAYVVSHASGYYMRYLLAPPEWKLAVYGARSLVNTWGYALTGRRLPGFLGDTIYQSARRLKEWYETAGLSIEEERFGRPFLVYPTFIYHRLRKT